MLPQTVRSAARLMTIGAAAALASVAAAHGQAAANDPVVSKHAQARLQARVLPAAYAAELRRTVRPPAAWAIQLTPGAAKPDASAPETEAAFREAAETLAEWRYHRFARVSAAGGQARWMRADPVRDPGDPCSRAATTVSGAVTRPGTQRPLPQQDAACLEPRWLAGKSASDYLKGSSTIDDRSAALFLTRPPAEQREILNAWRVATRQPFTERVRTAVQRTLEMVVDAESYAYERAYEAATRR